ncbi:3-keto-5-aminohexanoate cleavage protein [Geoglobus acetivorans]|uniref:3-keto-5-aminohexanoate cleavage protein n=1 Tax=Geoglobus acetivorans TaxID=565033 RepID=A0ABZ3H4C1_GEOAI|nr:3-keto-5-aminohexanoate cleavage protein [Geoglobus acetivorans]
MSLEDKIIITCAVTGSIHTPTMSPYLPTTPEQIVEEAVRAAEAGAAVVHVHARDPKTGMPTANVEIFREILSAIKDRSDVVICPTTGGGIGMSVEERIRIVPELKPEMASFNMGSMNFSLHHMLRKYKEFKYDWEKEYLEMSKDFVFRNTFKDLEVVAKVFYENETKPELECYDVGHIYNAAFLVQTGVIKMPVHMQFVHGILGGIGTHIDDMIHMKRTADRFFGDNYTWSVIGAGRNEFRLCTVGAIMGGHVRVGMEDNLYLEKGRLAKSNAELVKKMARIARELGREPATPDEARKILGLKGKDKANF